MEARRLLVLDACCVINLCATGRAEEILGALPYLCAVVQYVLDDEALSIGLEGGGPEERERTDLTALVGAGLLEVKSPSTAEEIAEHVRFALELDEGEAQTCAVAAVHRAAVATDDRKALRLIEREGLVAVQTPELLHSWAEDCGPGEDQLCETLHRVESLASFRPRQSSPFGNWWHRLSEP